MPRPTLCHDPRPPDATRPGAIAEVVAGIATSGLAIVGDFLPAATIAALRGVALRRDAAGDLAPAAVGRVRSERPEVRGDRILWLDERPLAPCAALWLAALDALSTALNRELMLGLWRYEGHYALYPPGAAYARHRDTFAGDTAASGERVVSSILYLNRDWRAGDGGALRIYVDDGDVRDVIPVGGTLVAFLAAQFEHEVLPAVRPRLALTGWLRRRPALPA